MVKTITMTALLFLAGVGAVLWLMPYEWLWIVLPAVTLLLCAVSVALYWYEVRLPIGRMIASMQAMREGQAVTLDDARRDDEFGQLARAIVEFSIRNQHHLEEVRRRKDDFQRLFDMVPCGISVQDREYRLLRWNHSFAVRYDPQPGNTCYEVYKGRTTPCPECSVQRTWEEGAVQCNQESRVNPDGTRDYWFVQTVPLFDKDGNVSSVMEMSIDMTLIHTLQHQLQASERTHKAIFDSIPNAVFLLDAAELTILDCNPASVKMYGRQRENELIGRGILDLFLPAAGLHRLFRRDEHQGRRHAPARGHPFRLGHDRKPPRPHPLRHRRHRTHRDGTEIHSGRKDGDARRNGDRGGP